MTEVRSDLEVSKKAQDWWQVKQGDVLVADLLLDPWHQMKCVVLYGKDAQLNRDVKKLSLAHACRYICHRERSGFRGIMKQNINLTELDSDMAMDLASMPVEVWALQDDERINHELTIFVTIVEAVFSDLASMVQHVVDQIKERHDIKISVSVAPRVFDDEKAVTFAVEGEEKFRFWNSANKPDPVYSPHLHIVPSYHPVMQDKTQIGLVNGSTGAFIRGHESGIITIACPVEARTARPSSLGSTWQKVNHPFYADGRTFDVVMDSFLCLSEVAAAKLLDLLEGALNITKKYVPISGGFNPPYDYPRNVLNRRGLMRPKVRGSEHSCVWEYKTLEKEGMLEGAYIPPWFYQEGWLEIYADEGSSKQK